MPVRPAPVCTSSTTNSASCRRHSACISCRNRAGQVVVAALGLDRLGDEGRRCRARWAAKASSRLRASAASSAARLSAACVVEREAQRRGLDAAARRTSGTGRSCAGRCWSGSSCSRDRPWKARRRCSTWVPSSGLRPSDSLCRRLPVERGLQRVLHRERAALDEEQVRQSAGRPGPGRRSRRTRASSLAVDVGVGRLVDAPRAQQPWLERLGRRQRRWFIPSALEAKKVNMSRYSVPSRASTSGEPRLRSRSSTRSKPSTSRWRTEDVEDIGWFQHSDSRSTRGTGGSPPVVRPPLPHDGRRGPRETVARGRARGA